jgi:hypothetical protein
MVFVSIIQLARRLGFERVRFDYSEVQGNVTEKTLSGKGHRRLRMVLGIVPLSGDRGIRTPNLRDANAALSQLSYIPTLTA